MRNKKTTVGMQLVIDSVKLPNMNLQEDKKSTFLGTKKFNFVVL